MTKYRDMSKEEKKAYHKAYYEAHKDYCYTPYVGHYALLVEAAKEKEADKILFGTGE